MLDASDEIADSGEALPEGFDARFAIVLAGEEAAQHGDLADHFAQGGHGLPHGLLGLRAQERV